MKLLVKIGGAPIEDASGRASLARSVLAARRGGHSVILVHGGGNQIRTLTKRLGIEDRYVDGLRVTDAETADVALMTLGGLVNRQVVAALQAGGVAAVGLTGADGNTFTVRRYARSGQDLGYVGEVKHTNRRVVELLVENGIVPVLATVAPLAEDESAPADRFYNVNADQAAGPLAAAFHADVMLFLSDVPGVLGADKRRLQNLDRRQCVELQQSGVITGGMIPKVEAALHAVATARPGTLVKIAKADGDNAILAALANDVGTTFRP